MSRASLAATVRRSSRDDVLGAEVGLWLHLAAPLFQVLQRGVAQEGHAAAMAVDDGAGGLGLAAAGGIIAAGDGVLDHGVGDDQRHVGGERRETEAEVAAIEQQRVIRLAVGGDELVHDAAVGADELILDALAEAGEHGAADSLAPISESTASAVTTSSAAELERPEPSGTSPQMLRLKPGILWPSPAEDGDDAHRVVAPVLGWRRAWRRRRRSFLRRSSRPR